MKNQASFLLLSRNFESCYMSKKENLRSLLAIKSDSGHISESLCFTTCVNADQTLQQVSGHAHICLFFKWANSCGEGEKGALENVDLAKIMYASPVKNFPQASLGIATTCIKVNDQQNRKGHSQQEEYTLKKITCISSIRQT